MVQIILPDHLAHLIKTAQKLINDQLTPELHSPIVTQHPGSNDVVEDCYDMETSSGEEGVCRVCRAGVEEGVLMHPCLCKGSIREVHEQCLIQWLDKSKKNQCELCGAPLMFTKGMSLLLRSSAVGCQHGKLIIVVFLQYSPRPCPTISPSCFSLDDSSKLVSLSLSSFSERFWSPLAGS